jgi:hypothetical protein
MHCLEETNVRVQTKAHKAKEKLRGLRRNTSCHFSKNHHMVNSESLGA